MTIEIAYQIRQEVKTPVFGVGIFRNDGIQCYGTNTYLDQVPLPAIPNKGRMRFKIENLDLLEGTYLLDVAVHDMDQRPYDYLSRHCAFKVRSALKDVGIFRPKHQWSVEE